MTSYCRNASTPRASWTLYRSSDFIPPYSEIALTLHPVGTILKLSSLGCSLHYTPSIHDNRVPIGSSGNDAPSVIDGQSFRSLQQVLSLFYFAGNEVRMF